MAIRKPLFLGGFGAETLAVGVDGIDLGNAAQVAGDLTYSGGGEPRGLPAVPTADDAGASKKYVDDIAVGSRVWKELILVKEQLLNGASGGVLQGMLMATAAVMTAADTVIITDGTTTETWTAVAGAPAAFQFQIGGTAAITLANLVAAINNDSTLWSAVDTTGLDAYFGAGYANQAVVYRTATSTAADRMYGVLGTVTDLKVVEFATGDQDYVISSGTESDLPAADPAAKRFGFGRLFAALVTNETHLAAEDNGIRTWDTDDQVWQQIDSSAITAGEGLLRTNDVIDVELDTAAAATGAGSSGGSSGLEFDTTGSAAKLRAAVATAGALERAATGLSVRVDGSTINIVGNQLVAAGAAEAQKVENDITTTAGVTAGDPVYYSGNDAVDSADAASAGGTGQKVIGVARTTVGAAGTAIVVSEGFEVPGVLTALAPTAGDPVWLANGGGLTLTAPTGANDRVLIGYAANANDLWVHIEQMGRAA
jgi:hypothetical protein